jgi:5-methylthioadenosine/S-adenosylhomocysteine deaminase
VPSHETVVEKGDPMDLLIHNGLIVTMDAQRRIIQQGALVIQGDRILDIGAQDEILKRYPDFQKMDARGKAILPGLVNLHTHTILTALRGVAEDAGEKALFGQMMPMMHLMTGEDMYVMALLGCLEALKSGATCIVENFGDASETVKAIDRIGFRAVVSEFVRDVDLFELSKGTYRFDRKIGQDLLQKSVDLMEKWHGKDNGRIRCHFSPVAPDMCSTWLLKEIKTLSEKFDVGVALHLSQKIGEVEHVLSREGKRPVEYLEEIGLLGPRVIGAHCSFINEREIEILGKTRTNVSHNAAINARRGHIAPVCALREAGANIGLGSDNMTEDMIEVMRVALMVGRIKTSNGTALLPYDVMEMATVNGAKALGLGKEIGSLELGKKADLIMIDLNKPHLVPLVNVVANIVHTGMASDVDTVIVDGRILMEARQVKTIDEKEVMDQAQKSTESLWKRFYERYG